MVDAISKILSIILIFVMLVVGPLVWVYTMQNSMAQQQVLLEVTRFIDIVRDTRTITDDNLDELYQRCNTHGIAVDVKVRRAIKSVVVDDDTDEVEIAYTLTEDRDDLYSFNKGDGVQVIVTEIGVSRSRQYIYNVLGADMGALEFQLMGVVG